MSDVNAFSAPEADDVLLPLRSDRVTSEHTINVATWFIEAALPGLAEDVAFLAEDSPLRSCDISAATPRQRRWAQVRWRVSLLPGATHIELYRSLTAFLTLRNSLQRSRWNRLKARIEDRIQRALDELDN